MPVRRWLTAIWEWTGRVDLVLGRLNVLRWACVAAGGLVLLIWVFLLNRFGILGTIVLLLGGALVLVGTAGLVAERRKRQPRPVSATETDAWGHPVAEKPPNESRIIRFTTGEQAKRRVDVGFKPTFIGLDYPATGFLRQRDLPVTLYFLEGGLWFSRFDETGFSIEEHLPAGIQVQIRAFRTQQELDEEEELRLGIASSIEQAQELRAQLGPFVPLSDVTYIAHQADEIWAPSVKRSLEAYAPSQAFLFWEDRGKAWGSSQEVAEFLDKRIAELKRVLEEL